MSIDGGQEAKRRWKLCLVACSGIILAAILVVGLLMCLREMKLRALMADLKAGKTTTLIDPDVNLLDALAQDEECATAIKTVYVSSSLAIADSRFSTLRRFPNLQAIRLEYVKNTDVFLEHIDGMASLKELSFHHASFSETGASRLRTFPHLEVLRLDSATDDTLNLVADIPQLKELELGYGQISDAGLEHLKRLHKLERLNLWYTGASSAGIARFQEALPNCKISVDGSSGPLITVSYDWSARTPIGSHVNSISVGGPLFTGTSGRPSIPGVAGNERTIDGKQYNGIVVSDDKKDPESHIFEVFVHGEKDRALIFAKSKVNFVITTTHDAGKHLTWIESGKKKEGPIELSLGQHQIEIVEE